MAHTFVFLPAPRRLDWLEGTFDVARHATILLDPKHPQALRFAAQRYRDALTTSHEVHGELIATSAAPGDDIGLTLLIMPEAVPMPEGYRLRITSAGIVVRGHDAAGVFYGVCTLIQLLEQAKLRPLPCLEIVDWPDFSARGVMLDVSRNKVPKMETLLDLVDRLASWKVNQVQLYTEHTFAYRNHREVWEHASPITGEEILS